MNMIKTIAVALLMIVTAVLLSGCSLSKKSTEPGGTAWGDGAFSSNGERIYFTATSERGTAIAYTGGPGSKSWMMGGGGRLACASCHGTDGRGGIHSMGMMQKMDAKDIRWSVLEGEFDADKFRLAVVEGKDPDGTQLNTDMPRWNISSEDLADLIDYLKTLP
jgi:hypothetical protein